MGRRNNILTTDVTYKFENKENEIDFATSLELFIQNAKLRNLREHTIKYYLNELKVYNCYLVEQDIGAVPSKVTEEIIEKNIIVYMQDQGLKTVTINSRLRAIRAYFNFLHKHGHIKKNPVENVKLLKDRKHITETFSKEQINKLLKAPDIKTFTGLRDYTIMLLLLDTGVRVNELIGIDVQDVKLKEGVVVIRNTKNNFERVVPIQKKMKDVLEKYLAVRGVVDDPALFLTIEDTRLSKKQVQNRIAHYGLKARLEGVRCSPHTFRHTFAKMCVQSGSNVFELQQILGHSSLEMVRNYVNLFSSEVKESHNKFSPLKGLSTRV